MHRESAVENRSYTSPVDAARSGVIAPFNHIMHAPNICGCEPQLHHARRRRSQRRDRAVHHIHACNEPLRLRTAATHACRRRSQRRDLAVQAHLCTHRTSAVANRSYITLVDAARSGVISPFNHIHARTEHLRLRTAATPRP